MSFKYQINTQQNIVFIHFSDKLDDKALLDAFNKIYADPQYSPVMNQCIDYSDVTELSITRLGVERLTALCQNFDCLNIKWKTCIVAPDDLSFGYGRMYQILSDGSNEDIDIVRDRHEALRLLELTPGAYPFSQQVAGETP